jgi:hypothetical protein
LIEVEFLHLLLDILPHNLVICHAIFDGFLSPKLESLNEVVSDTH